MRSSDPRPNRSGWAAIFSGVMVCGGILMGGRLTSAEELTLASGAARPVWCRADRLEYGWERRMISADGGVRLVYEGLTLWADAVLWSVATDQVQATGRITLVEGSHVVTASSADYNLVKRAGHLQTVRALYPPWTVVGRMIEKTSEKDLAFLDGYLTTCDDPEHPHWKMAASRIHVLLDDMVEANHMFMYAGPLPVFWFPYLSRSLKGGRSPLEIKPGLSTTEGPFLKATYHYDFAPWFHGEILGDWLTQKGFGWGLRHAMDYGGAGRTAISFYTLQDTVLKRERTQVNVEHQHQVTPELLTVARVDWTNDETLQTTVSTVPSVNRYLRSYAAMTYRMPFSTFNISAQEDELFDVPSGVFRRTLAELPRIQWSGVSVPLAGGFYAGLSGDLVRSALLPNSVRPQEVWGWRGTVRPYLSHTMGWGFWSWQNTATWLTAWEELDATTGVPKGDKAYTHQYDASSVVHQAWGPFFQTDVGYAYGQQLVPLAPKGGVVTNRLRASAVLGRMDRYYVSGSSGYNLLPLQEELVNGELERYDPITAELRVRGENMEYSALAQYNLLRQAFLFFNHAVYASLPDGTTANAGLSISRDGGQAALPIINVDVFGALRLPLGWCDVNAGFRYELLNDLLKEQRYGLALKLSDCWELGLNYAVNRYLVGTTPTDRAFFSFDLRLRAFPSSGVPLIPSGVLF